MPGDPESTRAKVQKRKPASHSGGEAANRWAQDTPKKTAPTNLPRLTPRPQTTSGPRLTQQPKGHQPSQIKDTKSDHERHRAAGFKRSKEYRGDVRAAYLSNPTKRRSELAQQAAKRDTPEAQAVSKYHQSAIARNRELESSHATRDTKGQDDYFRGRPVDKELHEQKVLTDLAHEIIGAHRDQQYTDPSKDVKSDLELATADAFKTTEQFAKDFGAAAKAGAEYKEDKRQKKYSGNILGFIHDEGAVAGILHGAGPIGSKIAGASVAASDLLAKNFGQVAQSRMPQAGNLGKEVGENAGKELIDIPANAIPSLYYGLSPLGKGDVTEAAKRLALDPYAQLAKDPAGSFTSHPLSSTLMLTGPLKGGDALAGRARGVVRPLGARTSAIVPGTSLETLRANSKGIVGQVIANRSDRAHAINPKGEVLLHDKGIRQRVNESFDHSQHNIRNAAQDLLKEHKKAGGKIDDGARAGARALAVTQRKVEETRMIDEFAVRAHKGKKMSTSGQHSLTSSRHGDVAQWKQKADAEDFINRRDFGVPMAARYDNGTKSWKVLPQSASNQLDQFGVGRDAVVHGPMTKAAQSTVAAFRRTVLATPFTKWMAGNVGEAALRSMLGQVGPRSIATGIAANRMAKRTYTDAEYREFSHRVLAEGHYGMDLGLKMRSSPDEYGAGKLAQMAKALDAIKYSKKSPIMPAYKLWEGWTGLVFNTLNGRMERAVRIGMLGKALRNDPLMTENLVKLHAKAIHQAVDGMKGTPEMVKLGREIDHMYGKYSKFSPEQRKLIANYTPFLAWYLNATKFVLHNLPADHPVVTSLIASASQASEGWRKDKGLSVFEKGAVPGWLQGSIPVGTSKSRVSHFTPFGLWGDLPGNWASVIMPLLNGSQQNLNGKDWKGDDLPPGVRDNPYARAMTAALTLTEATVPGTGVAYRFFTGDGSTKEKVTKELVPGKPVPQKKETGGGLGLPDGFKLPSSGGSSSLPSGFSIPGK